MTAKKTAAPSPAKSAKASSKPGADGRPVKKSGTAQAPAAKTPAKTATPGKAAATKPVAKAAVKAGAKPIEDAKAKKGGKPTGSAKVGPAGKKEDVRDEDFVDIEPTSKPIPKANRRTKAKARPRPSRCA